MSRLCIVKIAQSNETMAWAKRMSNRNQHWATHYVGLPYLAGGRDRAGLDCWGLLRLVYLEQRGIELPQLPGVYVDDELLISRENLAQCVKGWTEQPLPVEWCAVGMSRKTIIHHVGIWTEADGGKVIHCFHGKPVTADTPKSLLLKGLRIKEYFVWPT